MGGKDRARSALAASTNGYNQASNKVDRANQANAVSGGNSS